MKCDNCGIEINKEDGLSTQCLECAIKSEELIIKRLISRKNKYKTQVSKDRMDSQIKWGYEEIERLKSGYFKQNYANRELYENKELIP